MPNRRPPFRRLVPLRLAGIRRLTQLEAHAILHMIRFMQAGDWLAGFKDQERDALDTLREKLLLAVIEARRQSIPKGLAERPDDAPTIWDTPVKKPRRRKSKKTSRHQPRDPRASSPT